ncbi:hypothetical protein DICVIV_12972 [Dictyocaulus viviparus]|uniref:Uncharacterized protein n=1 Tax=Dictyocaulus viviparus TaxID=29172 RepID=A0A0D8XF37_DICVI|nr:hypothetical protein DICVIV_12972 [Dictyocaulus viviparus]
MGHDYDIDNYRAIGVVGLDSGTKALPTCCDSEEAPDAIALDYVYKYDVHEERFTFFMLT